VTTDERVLPRPRRAPAGAAAPAGRAGLLVALVVLGGGALVALVLAATFSGALRALALADPGAVVRWATPAAHAVAHLAAPVTVGALLMVVTLLPRTLPGRERRRAVAGDDGAVHPLLRPSLALAGGAGGVWAVAAGARVVLDYATVAGESPGSASFGAQLGIFVGQISLGRMLLTVALLAALTTTLTLAVTTPTGAAWTLAVAFAALGVLAQLGHAAGAADHALAISAMFLHLGGAALWVGGLAALAVFYPRLSRADLAVSTARYSTVALWAFVMVGVSGLASAWIRVGSWSQLGGTRYGLLVVTKGLLLVALGTAGVLHRRVTLPRLATTPRLFWRLAVVELLVMGAVTGVAVALAQTAPPIPQAPPSQPSPAELVTGYPAPPAPSPGVWLTQWRPDLVLAFAGVAMAVVYLGWVVRLARRGDRWPVSRTVSWVSASVAFVWVTNGAPMVYGTVLFSVHMVEHMALATLLPVLFALGAPVTLALRALPVRTDRSRGPREWLLAIVESRWARFLAHPLVAAVNFAGSMIVFYYTGLFEAALSSHVGHVVMIIHFTLAGYLFANVLIGVDPGPRRPAYPVRLVLLFATMAFHAFFGVALAESTALLAADWFGALGLPWGVDALADQRQGANLAWATGELPTLALAVGVAVQWAREDERAARRRDRAAERDGDADLAAYNAMLAQLAERAKEGR
jgi:putative copper resistance protein D